MSRNKGNLANLYITKGTEIFIKKIPCTTICCTHYLKRPIPLMSRFTVLMTNQPRLWCPPSTLNAAWPWLCNLHFLPQSLWLYFLPLWIPPSSHFSVRNLSFPSFSHSCHKPNSSLYKTDFCLLPLSKFSQFSLYYLVGAIWSIPWLLTFLLHPSPKVHQLLPKLQVWSADLTTKYHYLASVAHRMKFSVAWIEDIFVCILVSIASVICCHSSPYRHPYCFHW